MSSMVDTSRAWFFIDWNLQSREDKTQRKNYNIRQYMVGVEMVSRFHCPQGRFWFGNWFGYKAKVRSSRKRNLNEL